MTFKTWCLVLAALWAGAATTVAAGTTAWRHLVIDGYQVRWERPPELQAPLVLSWRIAASRLDYGDARNCRQIAPPDELIANSNLTSEAFHAEVSSAFSMWQRAANIQFVEKPGERDASIVIGAQIEPNGRAFADVAYDPSTASAVRAIRRSLICLNPRANWKIGFDGNLEIYDLRYAIAHEIGHAIGLDHPESGRGTLMDFRYEERSRDLQMGDISGATIIYGPSTAAPVTNSTNHRRPATAAPESRCHPRPIP